jgi:hypothetical protein
MEQIQIFKKKEGMGEWEFLVLLGHESKDVGFLVKVHSDHWRDLSQGKYDPEALIKKSFKFLLKKQSKYSIERILDLREVQRQFPEYETEMRKKSLFAI